MDPKTPKKKRAKTDLLAAGLRILAEHGEGALTIDSICGMLGVTKGSFYHHFGSREAFSRQLLEYWEQEHTNRFIDFCDKEKSAWDRLYSLDAIALEMDDEVEVAVRAWALRDPQAMASQRRIDEKRLKYLHKIYLEITGDETESELFSQLEYAVFIGLRQMTPRLDKERINELIALWNKLAADYRQGDKL